MLTSIANTQYVRYRARLFLEHPAYCASVFVQDLPSALQASAPLHARFDGLYGDVASAMVAQDTETLREAVAEREQAGAQSYSFSCTSCR